MIPSLHVERIRSYLSGIEKGGYSRNSRLMLWRLLISAAHDGFEAEVSELESLSVPMADPAILSLTGEPVV